MPSRGLSLIGMIDEAIALQHMANLYVPKDKSGDALRREWAAARTKLKIEKRVVLKPGQPEIKPIPDMGAEHIRLVLSSYPFLSQSVPPIQFAMVEIAPLIAFQLAIDLPRSNGHCGDFSTPPGLQELLGSCLPLSVPEAPAEFFQQGQSILIKSPTLNFRLHKQGVLATGIVGIEFGLSVPHVVISRYNGRMYLTNGYHRAYGAGKAGATHIPCILQEVVSPLQVGIREDGSTMPLAILESDNPPTLGHFIRGRAYPVQIKRLIRVLQVNWSDYVLPDE